MRHSENQLKEKNNNLQVISSDLELTNLVELLGHRALHQANKRAYTFLVDGEYDETHLTYQDLDRQARSIAAWLQTQTNVGDRVLLLYPSGLEYIAAFFGCLYAGCVAVPAYPPRLSRPDPRIQVMIEDAGAKMALTSRQILNRIERHRDSVFADLACFSIDMIPQEMADQWADPVIRGETLAYLQYTSGSTATPKGVMVNHANLLHNESFIKTAFSHTEETVYVSWLPFFHDAGLVGNIIQSLYIGGTCVLMSPMAFLQKPSRWLQAISDHQATISGAPNFAYELCVRKTTPAQRATLDLSCWKHAYNGAEPVRAETLERFTTMFEPYGFRRKAFTPAYGLAEATLVVSLREKDAPPITQTFRVSQLEQGRVTVDFTGSKDSQTLVSCGKGALDQRILIVDPDTLTPCSPNQIGEIWVAGPSVAQGYWNNPQVTAETFQAYLTDTGEGPFLRTGDLGFLENEELFITGRRKDLIIIRGRNYYPQDIELIIQKSHPALRPDCGAAFSVEINGEERLVIVQELIRRHRKVDVGEVTRAIRSAVAENYQLLVYAVILINTGKIAKTSSGKIQRKAIRQQFLTDTLDTVGVSILDEAYFAWEDDDWIGLKDFLVYPRTLTEEILADIWRDVLEQKDIGVYSNFFRLGGHSLQATQVISRVQEMLEIDLPLRSLFEWPTIAALARQIEFTQQTAVQAPPITPVSHNNDLPLSFSQERMWFLHQMDPDSAAYNIPVALRFAGGLNIDAMERSINEVVQRHEIARTTFVNQNGRPTQVIAPYTHLALPVVDLRHLPAEEREAEAQRRVNQEGGQAFDLVQGPLIRLKLFELSEQDHILLITMHHTISDAWSLTVFWRELALSYVAFSRSDMPLLPELPIQYADFAQWQRRWLSASELAEQMVYWRQQLAGAPLVLDLPTDRPRPAVQTFRGAYQVVPLPSELLEGLRKVSRRENTTLFMTLLAAFNVLMYRYTGREDILVGSPIANRHRLDVEQLLGTFVNTLVMRTDLSGNPKFQDLLARVREVTLAAYTHQDLPFEQLVDALHLDRDLSHPPLVQVTFNVVNAPMPKVELPDLTWQLYHVDRGAAQFDLTVSLLDTEQVQEMTVEYNSDLFEDATIKRMMGHFQVLLGGIVTGGVAQKLLDLPLLTGSEQRQLLAWNNTAVDYSPHGCLHQLFEKQVERSPDAVAVVFDNEILTYGGLNERANQLAHYLHSLGVGPETLVGVFMERSLEMVVALYGILKVGGAYVPLDPDYPPERIAFMMQDAQVPVLLTQVHLQDRLPENKARIIRLDVDSSAIAQAARTNPEREVMSENLAYVIYTSGSTGQPKGVMNTHQGICNRLLWMQDAYQLDETDTVLQKTPFSFDVSVWEFFWPLLVGARLVIAQPGGHRDSGYLVDLIQQQQITTLHFVPSMLQLFLAERNVERCHSLRRVICSGEALPYELQQQFFARLPTELHNLYGPTEAAVDVTYWACNPNDNRGIVPIGRPIANTQVHILDPKLQPVPVGVPGELHIGGVQVARGYLNRPELTAEKFIADPFSANPKARLYKTGDLVRYLPDGNIEFLGRLDYQVKIRGFRIELGEIETVLTRHPGVDQAVVLAPETDLDAADKQLVAYVVCQQEKPFVAGELREFLQQKLPDYMIPAVFIPMEALPLTPNGKINRLALPKPVWDRSNLGQVFIAPATEIEEVVAQIWSQVLRIEKVGVNDNYFELGGHSLLVTQVMARVNKTFQLNLPLRTFFEAPTIREQAVIIEDRLIAEIDDLTDEQAEQLLKDKELR